MDPFFVKLKEQREQNKQTSPEAEADRIVSKLQERIELLDRPQGAASVVSYDLNPTVQDLVRAKVGEVQITQIKTGPGSAPMISYRVSW